MIAYIVLLGSAISAADRDTLPPLKDGQAPQNFEEMWAGFDPRAEPLEVETLHQWEEGDIVLRIVRFRIGVFKRSKATLAAIYGYSKAAVATEKRLPGLVQIHGGGQYADHKAVLANARRGYATVSIAWAGRISAPGYRVTPAEVKLFWEGKTDDPRYKRTTDWGAVDAYHAPSKNPRNVFPSAKSAAWALDAVESPRNSGWFLCALAARRALTFLEQQAEVDPKKLGVYGHSMGGKLTVMAAVDSRVKVAAPSCGGISDRYNRSPLFRATIGDDVSLKKITCPIIFLSPANDFHGRIGDLPDAVAELKSTDWRVTCSPHHNHQDTPEYEVATLLWFDQHLKGTFTFPKMPASVLQLKTDDGVPTFSIKPDQSKPILSVDVYYTQHGVPGRDPHENTMHRFWHHARSAQDDGEWTARLPLRSADKPLWVYANVTYALEEPVAGAGYYYGAYTAKTFNVSSLLKTASPEKLAAAGVLSKLEPTRLIEDFEGDWQKDWFTYRPGEWSRTTHKLYDETWKAPSNARLSLEVRSAEPNTLVVRIDDRAAEVSLTGGQSWQKVEFEPHEFETFDGQKLPNWKSTRRLKLSPVEHLRPKRGDRSKTRRFGKPWKGAAPTFRNLRWEG